MKGALVVQSWMEEASLDSIEEEWGVQPGDLRSRVELMEWLLFAMRRILSEDQKLANIERDAHKILYDSIDEVHRRVRFGCKADILGLVSIKGIGRVRAREMAETLGVSTALDVSEITERDKARLSDLRGWSPKLVDNLVRSAGKSVRGRANQILQVNPIRVIWTRSIQFPGSRHGGLGFLNRLATCSLSSQ